MTQAIENPDFSLFGEDENLSCLLVKNDQSAIFEGLLHVRKEHRNFEYRKKYKINESHILVVMCRTLSIRNRVEALTEIKPDLIDVRKNQATNAGWSIHTVEIDNGEFAMIYY